MRVLGVDYGKKTIGIALSDPDGLIAQPLTAIKRIGHARDIEELLKIAAEYSVEKIVVGLPVNMNGTLGPQSGLVIGFVEKLKSRTALPIVTWDERLSTMAVERVLIEGDMTREKRKKVVDKLAASYILQGYLDSLRAAR